MSVFEGYVDESGLSSVLVDGNLSHFNTLLVEAVIASAWSLFWANFTDRLSYPCGIFDLAAGRLMGGIIRCWGPKAWTRATWISGPSIREVIASSR